MAQQNGTTPRPMPGPGGRGPGGPGGPRGPRPKLENPMGILKRLLGYVLRYYWLHYLVVVICIVASVLSRVQGTLFTQTLIDGYIGPLLRSSQAGGTVDYSPLAAAILRVGCFYLIGVLAAFIQQRVMIYITQGTQRRLRDDLFTHMESLPIKYFDTHAHGDIMSVYTNDIDTLRQMISQSIPMLLNSVITIISVLASMITLSVPLTIVTMVMVCITLFFTKRFSSMSGRYFVSQQRDLGAINAYMEEMINGQKVVKVFCHEDKCIEEMEQFNDNLFDSTNNANKFANIMGPINAQLGNVSYVACAMIGGALALSGKTGLTLGKLASFLTFNKSFNMPISQSSNQLNAIIMGLAGADRVFRLLDEKPEVDEGCVTLVRVKQTEQGLVETTGTEGFWAWKDPRGEESQRYTPVQGDVVFDDVDFGYTDEKMVLHNIDMYARAGQKIAFVGSTGAGKTTITNLINRFYDIQDGKIRYDGIHINDIKKADLRRSMGIVLQETNLFTGTVRENIRYGKLDATDEEVVAAARLANADGFISRLPQGYDTMLTGNGANLSQGQRQLIAIARAAIADPPVLILDEATSSIDTRTEKLVQAGMDSLMHGRTTFVIAHRLSTVRNSDCIMVLEAGRIIERGAHDQLIEAQGRYYQLYTGNRISS